MEMKSAVRKGAWIASGVSLLAISACGSAPTESTADESASLQGSEMVDTAVLEPGGAHQMPLRSSKEALSPEARVAATAHLNYYGGKVLSNVNIVLVRYGSGTYLSNITSTTAPSLSSFYTQWTKSAEFTWMSEYNTSTRSIGAGTFGGAVQITPAATRDKATITDANIQAEISAQITAGKLPAPTANMLYMVSFPKGKKITQGGTSSCVAGGFCAYHGTFKRNGTEVYYGVLPDFSAGSGCDSGCGSGTQFANTTSVASHEVAETVTDAEVGLATVVGSPLAWYDPNNGEIGDICNGSDASFVASDGHTYEMQKLWSNASNACIAHK
jgi:hypothetical protein